MLLSVPGPDAVRDVHEIINAAGEVVGAQNDSDCLHRRATHLLAEKGITQPTEDEVCGGLDLARSGQR